MHKRLSEGNKHEQKEAVADFISDEYFDADELATADCRNIPKSTKSNGLSTHPNDDSLVILIIKGPGMMDLVHELYRRAADEA